MNTPTITARWALCARLHSFGRRTGWALLIALCACRDDAAIAGARPGALSVIDKGGIRVECGIERVPSGPDPAPATREMRFGDRVRVTLAVTDTATGQGVEGVRPSAWIAPRPGQVGDGALDETTTRDIVRKLVGATFGSGATNLNTWFLATLNDDRTVAVIDPTVDFSRTRLKNLVELPAQGGDLAFGDGNERLFVTLPERGEIAVVDVHTMALATTIATGGRPQRLWRQPDTGLLFADDGDGSVHVIDSRTGALRRSIAIGTGKQWLAFDAGNRVAYAAAQGADHLTAIAGEELVARQLAALGGRVAGLCFASAADAVWTLLDDGRLLDVAPANGRVGPALQLPPGSGPLWVDPTGRWVFAADRGGNCVRVVDTATRAVARTVPCGKAPEEIAFDAAFAFVRCAGSRELTLVQLSALADPDGGPVLQVPILQREPETPSEPAAAPLLAVVPSGDAVLLGAPGEQLVYYYTEGTNAPMGSYQNYGRTPRAIAVLDSSLRAAGSGIYTTETTLEHYGVLDLYVYLDRPTQVYGSVPLRVAPDLGTVERLQRQKPLALPETEAGIATLPVGRDAEFRFVLRALDTRSVVDGKDDVRVLVHERFGNWQLRLPAPPHVDGGYAVTLRLPKPGAYQVEVQCASANLAFGAHRPLPLVGSDDVEGVLPAKPDADDKDKEDRR